MRYGQHISHSMSSSGITFERANHAIVELRDSRCTLRQTRAVDQDHWQRCDDFSPFVDLGAMMTTNAAATDLDLAALVASKICHDVIGPVGAIYNGLEILGEDDDPNARSYAMDVIRNVTVQASARLQFARFAFGAAGSAGSEIDLQTAREISEGLIGTGKHTLNWKAPAGHLPKNKAKLLLNLVANSVNALPRGGDIEVGILGDISEPTLYAKCTGRGARPPQHLAEFINGEPPEIDAMSVLAYYTWRLSNEIGFTVQIQQDGETVLISASQI